MPSFDVSLVVVVVRKSVAERQHQMLLLQRDSGSLDIQTHRIHPWKHQIHRKDTTWSNQNFCPDKVVINSTSVVWDFLAKRGGK